MIFFLSAAVRYSQGFWRVCFEASRTLWSRSRIGSSFILRKFGLFRL